MEEPFCVVNFYLDIKAPFHIDREYYKASLEEQSFSVEELLIDTILGEGPN